MKHGTVSTFGARLSDFRTFSSTCHRLGRQGVDFLKARYKAVERGAFQHAYHSDIQVLEVQSTSAGASYVPLRLGGLAVCSTWEFPTPVIYPPESIESRQNTGEPSPTELAERIASLPRGPLTGLVLYHLLHSIVKVLKVVRKECWCFP